VPTKCSGAAACVLDDTMYVVAGFHRVPVSVRNLEKQMMREDEGLDSSDDDTEEVEDR
jgi:hypothetical protein